MQRRNSPRPSIARPSSVVSGIYPGGQIPGSRARLGRRTEASPPDYEGVAVLNAERFVVPSVIADVAGSHIFANRIAGPLASEALSEDPREVVTAAQDMIGQLNGAAANDPAKGQTDSGSWILELGGDNRDHIQLDSRNPENHDLGSLRQAGF